MEQSSSTKGTSQEYKDFCDSGKQFASQLNAYIDNQVNLKRTNFWLVVVTVGMPHLLVAAVYGLLMLNVVPRDSVMTLFNFLGFYLLVEIVAVVFLLRRAIRAEKEGTAYLRKTEEQNVALLRELAKKDYPQEKPSLL